MAVPKQADFYRPVLEIVSGESDGLSHSVMYDRVADLLEISDTDRNQVFGGKWAINVHKDRAYIAARKLEDAGLLARPERGLFRATQEGGRFLGSHEGPISGAQLTQIARELQQDDGNPTLIDAPDEQEQGAIDEIAPILLMEQAFRRQTDDLRSELLATLNGIAPERFEDLVADLLTKMGYGEVRPRGPRSRDGGIDGVIDQDKLGLDKVLLQAKRWDGAPVREPSVREFSGSLTREGANKGVFITTSKFTADAEKFATALPGQTIRLINGLELANLMIEYGVGVVVAEVYAIKKLDENYFAEDL